LQTQKKKEREEWKRKEASKQQASRKKGKKEGKRGELQCGPRDTKYDHRQGTTVDGLAKLSWGDYLRGRDGGPHDIKSLFSG
jgi:hypothetical protein